MELVVISGEELDFDLYEEFEDVESVDLFYNIEGILNSLADDYASILKINDYQQVYQTKQFQDVVEFVCSSLKTALHAEPEQFSALQKEYHAKLIVPQEYLADIVIL